MLLDKHINTHKININTKSQNYDQYYRMDYFRLNRWSNRKILKPGNDAAGWITTIIIGIVGSVLGGFLGRIFFEQT